MIGQRIRSTHLLPTYSNLYLLLLLGRVLSQGVCISPTLSISHLSTFIREVPAVFMTNLISKAWIWKDAQKKKKKSDTYFLFLSVAFQHLTCCHLISARCPILSETQEIDCLLNFDFSLPTSKLSTLTTSSSQYLILLHEDICFFFDTNVHFSLSLSLSLSPPLSLS